MTDTLRDTNVAANKALVLGGGASLGRALHWGLASGFLDCGIDLREADLIIGTSAGSVVGSLLALGADPRQSAPPIDPLRPLSAGAIAALQTLMAGCARAAVSANPVEEWKTIGRVALAAETVSEDVAVARPTLAAVTGRTWPKSFRATAVNATTGEFKLWSADDHVSLERAIASSTALPGVWPPITIGNGRYIDGGVRSMLNADLAAGASHVLVVSCFDLAAPADAAPSTQALNQALRSEIAQLRATGSTVEVITPDQDFLELSGYGTKMLDSSLVPQAYELAKKIAQRESERIRRLWSSKLRAEAT